MCLVITQMIHTERNVYMYSKYNCIYILFLKHFSNFLTVLVGYRSPHHRGCANQLLLASFVFLQLYSSVVVHKSYLPSFPLVEHDEC